MIMKANKQIGFIYKDNESIDKILKDGDVVFERGFLREKTSTTLPTTFGGVGKDLKDYRVYGNTVQSKLPSGYTQVDYIESSGTQYIDTGFTPNQDTSVYTKVKINSLPSGNKTIFGSRISANVRHFGLTIGGDNVWYTGYGTLSQSTGWRVSLNEEYEIKKEKGIFTLGSNQYTQTSTDFTSPGDMYIFAMNQNNETIAYTQMKLYYCKIYNDDILVRDFIPCYRNSDNEVGLYDLVNDVFYTNQGTGVFTYGSIAPTPDAPIEMVSCGDRTKNLTPTNVNDWEQGTIKASSGINQDNTTRIRTKNYYEIENDMDYYVSLEEEGYVFVNIILYDSNKTYLGQYYNIDSSFVGVRNKKINIPSSLLPNVKYYRFVIRKISDSNILPSEISIIKPMIALGDTKLDFEPYGYKIPVNVRSENLFKAPESIPNSQRNLATYTKINDNSFSLNYIQNDSTNRSPYVRIEFDITKFKPNTQYTISKKQTINGSHFANCGSLRTYINGAIGAVINGDSLTFTTPSQINSIGIYFYLGYLNTVPGESIITFNEIQLVEGSVTPAKYIPYYNETTNIYLDEPLRKIDEYSDYIDFINGKVVRQLGENIPNLNDLSLNTNYTNVEYVRFLKPTDFVGYDLFGNYHLLCSHAIYSANPNNWDSINNVNKLYTGAERKSWWIGFEKGTGLDTIKQRLENCSVIYRLATPTEESITLPNIPTIDGNNILNIETEITPSQVYIKYKSNT